jgi:glycerol-3-phosphate acyltransferase PlsX
MRIAVDAMGGDHAPTAIVEGAILAVQEYEDIEIVLVGRKEEIEPFIKKNVSRLSIIHTEEVIGTDEEPVKAVRGKKDSSLVQVTRMVKDKEVDACISAGNTGAYMTAGLLVTGRMKGIERPGLTIIYPTTNNRPCIVLDVGANMDAKPEHLLQYAKMGRIYAENILGYENPTVGLLNVGTEDTKGNDLMKKTFPLLKEASLNFIGNVEGRDVPFGVADIIVCDGFTGNVLLKVTEGVASSVSAMLKEELTKNITSKIGALLLKSGLKSFKKRMDYSEYGGAPLLGLNGVCIKAHGSSNATAIKNAIGQARKCVRQSVNDLIKREVVESERV